MTTTDNVPRKVWAVTSGSYDDYRVQAFFDAEEDAHDAVAEGFGEDVDEFTFYPAGVAPVKRVEWRAWAVVGNSADDDKEPYVNSNVEWDLVTSPQAPKRPEMKEHRAGVGAVVSAWCSDRDAALKAVADRVAKLKAEREGL